MTEPETQHKAQLNESINSHKEEIKRIYAKYDKQKEFISVAAHELKSPITPILGTLELIEAEFEEAGKEDYPKEGVLQSNRQER